MPVESPEIIRPATTRDIPQLSKLFTEAFGTERGEEIWLWKYFYNPRGTASYVCEAGGRIVAHCGGIPVRFRDFEREYSALQSVDFMSSPSYPGGLGGGGVFVRTAERFFRAYCGPATIPLVYGFPGERHRRLGEKLLGYRAIEPVCEMRLEPGGQDVIPEPLRRDHLPEFTRVPLEFGAIRDERYLRWRYLDHPAAQYAVVKVRRALRLHARIAGLVRLAGDAIYLMEVAGSFSRSAVGSLTSALRRIGRPVIFWCSPQHPIAQLMRDSGFTASSRDHHLECRFFVQRQIPRPGEMYYTLGDYDVY